MATSPAWLKLRPVTGYIANYKEMATSTAWLKLLLVAWLSLCNLPGRPCFTLIALFSHYVNLGNPPPFTYKFSHMNYTLYTVYIHIHGIQPLRDCNENFGKAGFKQFSQPPLWWNFFYEDCTTTLNKLSNYCEDFLQFFIFLFFFVEGMCCDCWRGAWWSFSWGEVCTLIFISLKMPIWLFHFLLLYSVQYISLLLLWLPIFSTLAFSFAILAFSIYIYTCILQLSLFLLHISSFQRQLTLLSSTFVTGLSISPLL